MTRDDVVIAARGWVTQPPVPYRKKGRSRAHGVDCLGLLVMIARDLNLPHQDDPNYTEWPDPTRRMLRVFDEQLVPIYNTQVCPGMVGVFAEVRLPGHTGIFTELHGRLHLVHARVGVGIIEQEYQPTQAIPEMRLIRTYDFPGVT